ncbi:MAG TPA: DNA polymerase III subunit chi [Parachlamydiaceae bacterium]|nr:DNA polymerase III subunit chi [Parachlamydiaceae bacterium]
MQNPKITFFKISSNQEKLLRLIKMIQNQFDLGLKTLIACETEQAALYLDDLLWRFSEESFLPHAVENEKSNELIVITTSFVNVNKAFVLINLHQKPHPSFKEFSKIYELYDETHPIKEEASKLKRNFYQAEGFATSLE